MSTISGTVSNGIQLGVDNTSPLTIASTGYINAGTNGYDGAAIYAAAAAGLTLVNYGRVKSTGTVIGVLDGNTNGLSVANYGTITAVADAVVLQHAGPVTNSGVIITTNTAGTATNAAV